MYAKDTLSLPVGHAFVVQVYAEAEINRGRFFGRVKHIVSSQATHFDSRAAVVTFLTQMLTAQTVPDDGYGSACSASKEGKNSS